MSITNSEPTPASKDNREVSRGTGERPSLRLEITLLVVGLCAIAMYVLGPSINFSALMGEGQPQHSVVVIDSVAIENAKKVQLQESINDYAEVMREAEAFKKDLHGILGAYREAGIIVLNRHAVISMPDSVDITDQVAAQLSVSVPNTLR